MPRLQQVPRAETTPEVAKLYDFVFGSRDPVVEPGTATGTPGNWWTVFAQVPDVLLHAMAGFGVLNAAARELAPELRELALVRTGFLTGSRFVFSQHSKIARAVGISDEKVAALPSWTVSEAFDARERAVLAWVDDLVLQDGRIPDVTFERLREHLSERAILELCYAACTYRMHAAISRALRLEYDDVAERVTEVPAPPEFDPRALADALRDAGGSR